MIESKTAKHYLSDADYIREMKIVHPRCPETDDHNERIEQIARRLENNHEKP